MGDKKRYNIQKLLLGGVQPFEDLSPEQFEELKLDIKAKGTRLDTMPVTLSADPEPSLIDGHHRLQAKYELGRRFIDSDEWIIDAKINGQEASYDESVRIGMHRRHLDGPGKARIIWHYAIKRGWSQTKIAKKLHMKQPSVSELMKKYPAPPDLARKQIVTVGEDGKTYIREVPDSESDESNGDEDSSSTPYARKQHIKKLLSRTRVLLEHAIADADACEVFDPTELGNIAEDADAIKEKLGTLLTTLRQDRELLSDKWNDEAH